MNEIELHGTLFYESANHHWRGSGTGWWIERTNDNSAKITFEERIAFDPTDPLLQKSYSLSLSNINGNGDIHVSDADDAGFLVHWKGHSSSTCIASFMVKGTKLSYVPNDRALSHEESVADIYAAGLLFDYEAKYGVVTVMGSASITSKPASQAQQAVINSHSDACKSRMDSESGPLKRDLLENQLLKMEHRLSRHHKIEDRSTKYWDSAKKFGKLWGIYSTKEQEKALGGCHVPVCTGGGPGLMRAVAEGAREQHAHVIGIDCQFGLDRFFDMSNSYSIFSNQRLRMNNFSIREGVLINYSHVILFWPGGYGTAWEVFEVLSKISTKHLRRHRTKAIFVHSEFWQPLFDFISHMRDHGTINSYGDRVKIPGVDDQDPDEAYIAEVVDTAEEAFVKTKQFVEELYQKNQLTLRG